MSGFEQPNYTQTPNAFEGFELPNYCKPTEDPEEIARWVDWWIEGHNEACHLISREECEECQRSIALYGPMPSRGALEQAQKRRLISLRPRIRSRQGKAPKTVIPDALRWDVWERDNFTCQHCGKRRNLSVDHVVAESNGGATTLENLQTLCRSCNSRKGAR